MMTPKDHDDVTGTVGARGGPATGSGPTATAATVANVAAARAPAAALRALMERAGRQRGPAPVEAWDPPYCGDLDIRIAKDGMWHYLGTPIGRPAMVRLFASVLRRDPDGRTYLVTPVEKIGITVEDVPFVGVELHAAGEGRDQEITIRTNVGDVVSLGPEHRLRFAAEAETDGLVPYVHVRGGLEARLARPLLYELVDLGRTEMLDGAEVLGVWSKGMFFPMAAGADAFDPSSSGARRDGP